MTLIEIDLNVRVADNNTFTYLDDTDPLRQSLNEGDKLTVWESWSRLYFPASVVRIERDTGYIQLDVAWQEWKKEEPDDESSTL